MTPLGLWLISAFLLAPPTTPPQNRAEPLFDAVFTRQSTTILSRLMAPTRLGGELIGRWRLESLTVEPRRARFVLRDAEGRPYPITLLPPQAPCPPSLHHGRANTCIRSHHFLVVLPPGLPDELQRTLLTRFQANDREDPWQRPGIHPGIHPGSDQRVKEFPPSWPMLPVSSSWIPGPARLLEFLIIAWVLLTLLTMPQIQRAIRLDSPSLALALGIFALALWLRLSGTMPLPVGPNGHPNVTILELFRPEPQGFLFYGNTFWSFFHVLGGLLERLGLVSHPWQEALPGMVFKANAVLGAWIPLAALALARLAGMSEPASLAGAALLACLPIHLRLSASESRFVLASFFVTFALVQSMAAWRLRSWTVALAATSAWVLASQARPEIPLALVVLPLALALADRPRHGTPNLWIAAGLAGLLFVALDAEWLFHIAQRAFSSKGASHQLSFSCPFRLGSWLGPERSITWMNPIFVPRWMPLVALTGLLGLWLRRGGPALLFWSLLSLSTLATGACFAQGLNTARLQAHSLPWLAILAGQGLEEIGILVPGLLGSILARAVSIRSILDRIGLSRSVQTGFAQDHSVPGRSVPNNSVPGRSGPNNSVPGHSVPACVSSRPTTDPYPTRRPSRLTSWFLQTSPAFLIWALTILAASFAWRQGRHLLGPTCTAQFEYLFVTRQVAHLPADCTILVPDRQGIHNSYQAFFAQDSSRGRPTWIATNDAGRADALIRKVLSSPKHPCLLFYRPAACFATGPGTPIPSMPGSHQDPDHKQAPPHGRRSDRKTDHASPSDETALTRLQDASPPPSPAAACRLEQALRRHWRLQPMAQYRLTPHSCWAQNFDRSSLPVGFFRILPLRPAHPFRQRLPLHSPPHH